MSNYHCCDNKRCPGCKPPGEQPSSKKLDFSGIVQRDAMTAATWFTGPTSGPAQAYRDRRALIEAYAALRQSWRSELIEDIDAALDRPADETSALPDHVCGLQGFGRGIGSQNDVCPACDAAAEARTHKRGCAWFDENIRACTCGGQS